MVDRLIVPRAGQMFTSEALDEASALEKAAERFGDFCGGERDERVLQRPTA
jgi:hypothetical protein